MIACRYGPDSRSAGYLQNLTEHSPVFDEALAFKKSGRIGKKSIRKACLIEL